MIAFAAAITDREAYAKWAEPGIQLAGSAETDSRNLSMPACGSIAKSYNAILDAACTLDGLEALVLVHQDAEIADRRFGSKVRLALADPLVAVAGCMGSIGAQGIAWWEGEVTWDSHLGRFEEFGGGDLPGICWSFEGDPPPGMRLGEVDALDGFALALSPWTVRTLRFDEDLMGRDGLHGYDFDLCRQARSRGRRVVTADLKIIHHRRLVYLVDDIDAWIAAHVRVADKWGLGAPASRLRDAQAAAERLQIMEAEMRAEAAVSAARARACRTLPP